MRAAYRPSAIAARGVDVTAGDGGLDVGDGDSDVGDDDSPDELVADVVTLPPVDKTGFADSPEDVQAAMRIADDASAVACQNPPVLGAVNVTPKLTLS